MKKGMANIIIDGQWGSTGKGKVASYLALTQKPDIAVCCFAPNAGHTHYTKDGEKVVLKMLPSSIENPDVKIMLGPASVINIERLLDEIEKHGVADRLCIDRNATIVTDDDAIVEASSLEGISSTLQGTGAARARKIMRKASTIELVSDLSGLVCDVPRLLHLALARNETVLIESPQGFDLSLNFGHRYPFVTSRDIVPSALLADLGLLPRHLGDVYGVLRPHPIRVGNVYDEGGNQIGWSGPHYLDQDELTWDCIRKDADISRELIEKTTVTNKVRRVFSWSDRQFDRFMMFCDPDYLCFNHMDYIDGANYEKRRIDDLTNKTLGWFIGLMARREDRSSALKRSDKITKIRLLGTGPMMKDMIDLEEERVSWTMR